jgi:hypothetical protein
MSLIAVAAISLMAVMLAVSACAGEPELGAGPNMYTTSNSEARVRIMVVDDELSRQVQSGSLDPAALPAGKLVFREQAEPGNGQEGTPWVVNGDFFFTSIDIYYAEVEPAADGSFDVVYQLYDVQGRNNTAKLQQVTVEMAAAMGGTDDPGRLAVIYNEVVRGLIPITTPIVDGEIRLGGLTEAVAEEITGKFPDRAFFFPEEGRESRFKQ